MEEGMSGRILEMHGIVKEYDMGDEVSRVLKGIDLAVGEGEFLAVLGPSGSGKSTLMNIIGCLDVPTSGEYTLSGRVIASQDEKSLAHIRSREVGFVFQSFNLLQKQTALENVELPMLYANVRERERRERAREMLCKVGLGDKLDHYPNQMSGGQQQRVAIARAMVNNPTILLADEPTGALDQKTGAQVMELFHTLNDEGRCIIMITHDAKIASHAKRIVRILDGNISEGMPEDA
jgi:putative ABC transport system ATP-binding protein